MQTEWPIFALKLKLMRKAAGFTQKELAKLSLVGDKTISTFESGRRISTISVSQLMDLTWACGLTVVEFMERQPYEFGASRVKPCSRGTYLRQYRKQKQRANSYTVAVPIIKPKRGVTIFRSSDLLGSSLGEPVR